MLQFDEQRLRLTGSQAELIDLGEALGIKAAKQEIAELEENTAKEGFWDDLTASQKTLQKISQLKNKVQAYEKLQGEYEDTLTLIEMANEEQDESLIGEVTDSVNSILKTMEEMRLSTLLSGEYDNNNAILTFHAGAGGTEAQDWAQMLFRMYAHWADAHGFKTKTLDYLDGEEAGLKSAVVLVEGVNAYGYLKSEAGVHRLVRVSPFDSSGRRHTSFASLEVMPEISDDMEVEIRDEDLKVDTYRSSGAGGQHINKTESAIRITHIPTGIIVA